MLALMLCKQRLHMRAYELPSPSPIMRVTMAQSEDEYCANMFCRFDMIHDAFRAPGRLNSLSLLTASAFACRCRQPSARWRLRHRVQRKACVDYVWNMQKQGGRKGAPASIISYDTSERPQTAGGHRCGGVGHHPDHLKVHFHRWQRHFRAGTRGEAHFAPTKREQSSYSSLAAVLLGCAPAG